MRVLHIGSGQLAWFAEPVLKTVLRKPGLHEPDDPFSPAAGAALVADTNSADKIEAESIMRQNKIEEVV